jgi:hypothetical protein
VLAVPLKQLQNAASDIARRPVPTNGEKDRARPARQEARFRPDKAGRPVDDDEAVFSLQLIPAFEAVCARKKLKQIVGRRNGHQVDAGARYAHNGILKTTAIADKVAE